ncbi:MAG TPA: NADH-quinone oxidoreductase subunit A [Acidimicrobiales bacterium]|nr:NADH-quinone oxidoreductase subunit A [Acidimicrobiales bacterium]
MVQFLPIAIILVLAIVFAAGMVATPIILGPKRPTAAKEGPYESGIAPRRALAARYPVRFYLVGMIFIIFDIEVIFLYPWAVMYRQLSTFGLAEMGTFAAIVFVSFAYLVSNGALDWGPQQSLRNKPEVDLTRTVSATIRRVPRPDEVAVYGPALRPVDDHDDHDEHDRHDQDEQDDHDGGREGEEAAQPTSVGSAPQTGGE